ncbi:MAG TPA: hypothetical protein VFR58_14475 [Flavisolibacter sp.]|nr:hypothetical protein [Flavisolibacter sp.]
MKAAIPFVITAAALVGCITERSVQVSMVDVELVKIDTVQRYPSEDQKILTWRGFDNIQYVTYEPIYSAYTIGSKMKVMIRR